MFIDELRCFSKASLIYNQTTEPYALRNKHDFSTKSMIAENRI